MSFARKLQRRASKATQQSSSDAAANRIVSFLLHHPLPTSLVKACLRSYPVTQGPMGLCLTFVHHEARAWWARVVEPLEEDSRIYKQDGYHAGRVLTIEELKHLAPHLAPVIREEVKDGMRNRPHLRSTVLIVHADGEEEFQHWEMLTVERGPVAEDVQHGDNTGYSD